jgi:hypothetical protein
MRCKHARRRVYTGARRFEPCTAHHLPGIFSSESKGRLYFPRRALFCGREAHDQLGGIGVTGFAFFETDIPADEFSGITQPI